MLVDESILLCRLLTVISDERVCSFINQIVAKLSMAFHGCIEENGMTQQFVLVVEYIGVKILVSEKTTKDVVMVVLCRHKKASLS